MCVMFDCVAYKLEKTDGTIIREDAVRNFRVTANQHFLLDPKSVTTFCSQQSRLCG